jgi:hypothetical protein
LHSAIVDLKAAKQDAQVRISVRRTSFSMASTFPYTDVFRAAWEGGLEFIGNDVTMTFRLEKNSRRDPVYLFVRLTRLRKSAYS